MKHTHRTHLRVLAIAPSTRGFGFAVLEGQETLVDWGVKSVKKEKNTRCVAKVEELIAHYQPGLIVLEDSSVKDARRAIRMQALTQQIIAMASNRKLSVALISRQQVRRIFVSDGEGTKHAIAEILAARFPEELGFRLPPERRPWMSEDYRMNIFDAVALAIASRLLRTKKVVLNPLNNGENGSSMGGDE